MKDTGRENAESVLKKDYCISIEWLNAAKSAKVQATVIVIMSQLSARFTKPMMESLKSSGNVGDVLW